MFTVSPSRPSEGHSVACFSVQAATDPGIMPRVLQQFAKRGLVPARWHSATVGPDGGELHIDIQLAIAPGSPVEHLAACLRGIPGVGTVLTSTRA